MIERLDHPDPDFIRTDARVVAQECPADQTVERGGELHPGGPCAHNVERQKLGPPGRVVRHIRFLEDIDDPVAQCDAVAERLQGERALRDVPHPKEVGDAAQAHDQGVVGNQAIIRDHLVGVEVDPLNNALLKARPELAHSRAERIGDVVRIEHPGSDLIEQWGEEVDVVPIHHQDLEARLVA